MAIKLTLCQIIVSSY